MNLTSLSTTLTIVVACPNCQLLVLVWLAFIQLKSISTNSFVICAFLIQTKEYLNITFGFAYDRTSYTSQMA